MATQASRRLVHKGPEEPRAQTASQTACRAPRATKSAEPRAQTASGAQRQWPKLKAVKDKVATRLSVSMWKAPRFSAIVV